MYSSKSQFRMRLRNWNYILRRVPGVLDLVRPCVKIVRNDSNSNFVKIGIGMLPDADDTAKAIHSLKALGRSVSPLKMLSHFLTPSGYLATYPRERNPSPSANCNVLLCLPQSPDLVDALVSIERIIGWLCECWWNNKMEDKWV